MSFSIDSAQLSHSPRRSVVQIYFPAHHRTLSYYNDRFDLQCGDMVYVEGKLKGIRGFVREINYNFKIKLSDYKRVIAVVDTSVSGRFYFLTDSHLITFDRKALPVSKASLWFNPPADNEEDFITGSDNTSFAPDTYYTLDISPASIDHGEEYYLNNHVKYLCLDDMNGYAIVEGRECYEFTFNYENASVSHPACSCFCGSNCKHLVAAMMQLDNTLKLIHEHYTVEFNRTGYFALISKESFFSFAISGRKSGSLTLLS